MDDITLYNMPERAEAEFYRRIAEGAPIGYAISAACRVTAAEEMRLLVDEATALGGERARHYLNADVLTARADYLDPAGTRP